MDKSSITFLMPSFQYRAVGGFKVALEYANMLAADGHEVHVVYGDATKYERVPLLMCIKLHLKALLFSIGLLRRSCRIWFPLSEKVIEHNNYSLTYREVPKTDIYICSAFQTVKFLKEYPIENARKFYFVQDYETWGRTDEQVRNSYHIPMNKIVISNWLKDIIEKEEGEKCTLVPNGFDTKEYHITIPIKQKQKHTVSLLYHTEERKDVTTAMAALEKVKEHVPNLIVNAFGTPSRPADLPYWYIYHQNPNAETHLRINNESAIYIAASSIEGWGLTIGEAMLCGQAVACTDNNGFKEMAKDGETALLSPVKDADSLAKNILRLINDEDLRYTIAHNGENYIREHFSREASYKKFKIALGLV